MLTLLVLLVGCHTAHDPPITRTDAVLMQRSELFFGLSISNGGVVSPSEWQAFVDDTITPRFPDGLTVIDCVGQWRDSSGKISREPSKILLILHVRDAQTIEKLDEIRAEYKKRFHQESVIREMSNALVSF